MMSGSQIASMSAEAAKKASKEHKVPYVVWPEDISLWKKTISEGELPQFPFPFIGTHKPEGFEQTNEYFVDSSGFGTEGEPALTIREFATKVREGYAYAITEVGQFQLYITEYRRINADRNS